MEFKTFDEVTILESKVVITEKVHGTNAQIAISDTADEIQAGSRERWITPEDDNLGFARWVYENAAGLMKLLGPGRHFGEWYGPKLGTGYGLKERRFALFNTHRWTQAWKDGLLLPRMDVVPILYEGPFSPTIVDETLAKLKETGSALVPGWMRPEGVVVFFRDGNQMFKKVFLREDTKWDQRDKKERAPIDPAIEEAAAALLHPVRLEKLFMREERYLRDYPKSLPEICRAYIEDVVKESDEIKPEVLDLLKQRAFGFIKTQRDEYVKGIQTP